VLHARLSRSLRSVPAAASPSQRARAPWALDGMMPPHLGAGPRLVHGTELIAHVPGRGLQVHGRAGFAGGHMRPATLGAAAAAPAPPPNAGLVGADTSPPSPAATATRGGGCRRCRRCPRAAGPPPAAPAAGRPPARCPAARGLQQRLELLQRPPGCTRACWCGGSSRQAPRRGDGCQDCCSSVGAASDWGPCNAVSRPRHHSLRFHNHASGTRCNAALAARKTRLAHPDRAHR